MGGGLIWCEPDDHPIFSNNPFCQVAVILLILFLNHPDAKWLVWQAAATTFAFSSVFIHLVNLSYLYCCDERKFRCKKLSLVSMALGCPIFAYIFFSLRSETK